MNRKIKFRGKRVDNNEWVYGYVYIGIPETFTTYIIPEWLYNGYTVDRNKETYLTFEKYYEVIPETVGQLVGMLNDKEMYESDVVGVEMFEGTKHELRCVIEWDEKNTCYSNFSPKENFIIVGNIHDNSELLK